MRFKSDGGGNQSDLNGFLDSGSHVEGELRFETSFRVDGKFTGEVHTPGDLIVGGARNNFVRRLKARMRRKAALFPDDFSVARLARIWTVRQFDEAYTAPHHGFRDAADYYHRASAVRVLGRIRVPTLIVTAENDPFVPVAPFLTDDVRRHPSLSVVITADGGHCAFVEAEGPGYDGYWAEREVVRFAEAQRLRATTDAGKPTPSTVSR